MDIHKPKPIHSWSDFLKEVGIIVLGVLIALSAEQVVERFREARSAREAREAIREELVTDLSDQGLRRDAQPCIDHRLDEVASYLAASGKGEVLTPPNWIGRPSISRAQWQAATQSGRVSLLPRTEAATYAEMYYVLQNIFQAQNEEQEHWAELRTLERLPKLSPEMIKQFQVALSAARYFNWRMKLYTLRLTEYGERQNLKADPGYVRPGETVKSLPACIPITTSAAQAQALVGTSYGDPN